MELRLEIDQFVMTLIASRVETNAVVMRPFILKFIREFKKGHYDYLIGGGAAADDDGEEEDEVDEQVLFKCSVQWIRNMLKRLNQSYRHITNDAGNLPETWEEDRARMLVRVAVTIFANKIEL